jgi:hypothetical protein
MMKRKMLLPTRLQPKREREILNYWHLAPQEENLLEIAANLEDGELKCLERIWF